VFEEQPNGGNETQSQQAAIDPAGNGFHEHKLSEHSFLIQRQRLTADKGTSIRFSSVIPV
jgi:hypothetical protein